MTGGIGIDTSCYVTSLAVVDEKGNILYNGRTPLVVKQGGLGLRQQEAVFAHIKNLPGLVRKAFTLARNTGLDIISAGVSDAPRNVEGSYMPVFLAGVAQAEAVAAALNIGLMRYSHQQGHLRAAEVGNRLPRQYLGVHLSGGTSEIVAVDQNGYTTDIVGGSRDISAGQLIDRIGVAMGAEFPAGAHVERLALQAEGFQPMKSSADGAWFSFTGAEAECKRRMQRGEDNAAICRALLECIADTLAKALEGARGQAGLEAVLVGGGVAANVLIKERLQVHGALFAQKQYAGDNAAGVALLAMEGIDAG